MQLPEGTPDDLIVILDGKPIVTQLKDTPPDEKDKMWATYRKSDRTLMVVAEGKGNPAAAHKLQLRGSFRRSCSPRILHSGPLRSWRSPGSATGSPRLVPDT